MIEVSWLEQADADVPLSDDWLTPGEMARLASFRFPKRRADWRLGRWTAKRCIAEAWGIACEIPRLAQIEIRPAASGAPEIFFRGTVASATISVSHSAGIAICGLTRSGAALGCDVEKIEARTSGFVSDYFTADEQAMVAGAPTADQAWLATLIWSGKESALKALRTGLRLDTRYVAIDPGPLPGPDRECAIWRALHAGDAGGNHYYGWWQQSGGFMRTVLGLIPDLQERGAGNPVRLRKVPIVGEANRNSTVLY